MRDTILKIVENISKNPKETDFFSNGGCGKLAEFLVPLFFEEEKTISLCLYIFDRYSKNEKETRKFFKSSTLEEIINKVQYHDIVVDHIAIIQNEHIFDAYGKTEINDYKENYELPDCFLIKMGFDNLNTTLHFIREIGKTFIHAKYPISRVKTRLNKILY